MSHTTNTYEKGFIALLMFIAISGLIWLFSDFIPALFFAVLIATTSFSFYKKINNHFSKNFSSFLATLFIAIVIILPLSYIFLNIGFEINHFINTFESNKVFFINILEQLKNTLPFSNELQNEIKNYIDNNVSHIVSNIKDIFIHILNSSLSFISFVFVSLFSLFYFYQNGTKLIQTIKSMIPLPKDSSDLILKEFMGLSIVLMTNILSIAVLQGLAFAIVMFLFNLPWLFLGVLVAFTSFIPIIGTAIVWIPISSYLAFQGEYYQAIFVSIWSIVIIGALIDNIIRPLLLKKISKKFFVEKNILEHTLITVLSTFAGIMKFGVLGLFIGPIIAAMAITIFTIYQSKKNYV